MTSPVSLSLSSNGHHIENTVGALVTLAAPPWLTNSEQQGYVVIAPKVQISAITELIQERAVPLGPGVTVRQTESATEKQSR